MIASSGLEIFRQGVYLAVMIISVLVLPGLIIGLLVAMFQAATQINEMSLSFVPKLLATLFTLLLAGPWICKLLLEFTQQLFQQIPTIIH